MIFHWLIECSYKSSFHILTESSKCLMTRLPFSLAGSRLHLLPPAPTSGGSMTSGLVGEMQHQVLPSVPPWVTMVTTLAAMIVSTGISEYFHTIMLSLV